MLAGVCFQFFFCPNRIKREKEEREQASKHYHFTKETQEAKKVPGGNFGFSMSQIKVV